MTIRIVSPWNLALILVDVTSTHSCVPYFRRMEESIVTKLVPLLECVRRHKVTVIHTSHKNQIHKLAEPLPDEVVVKGSMAFLDTVLASKGITHLLYAGYASNMCIVGRPDGIIGAYGSGYPVAFVRDASIACISPDGMTDDQVVMGEVLAHAAAVHFIEALFGPSVLVNEVIESLERTGTLEVHSDMPFTESSDTKMWVVGKKRGNDPDKTEPQCVLGSEEQAVRQCPVSKEFVIRETDADTLVTTLTSGGRENFWSGSWCPTEDR